MEETLNELLKKETESLTQVARYERSEARQGYRSGHYDRILPRPPETHAPYAAAQGCVLRDGHHRAVSPPGELRGGSPLAGISMRRVEDITEALWGARFRPLPSAS